MENDNIPIGGLGTHFIIGIIATALLIVVTLIFFVFWNNSNQRSITLKNNSSNIINLNISSLDIDNKIVELPIFMLFPNSSKILTASPGVTIIVSGYTDSNKNPLTYAKLVLGNAGFASKGTIEFNGFIYYNLISTNEFIDKYGISLQNGYNLPITITPNNVDSDSNSVFSCSGPIWYQYINNNNPIFPCPEILQNAENCINPCIQLKEDYCKCEQDWEELDYYYTFAAACPNCLITTCDDLNYFCSNQNINNHKPIDYTITFMPNLGII